MDLDDSAVTGPGGLLERFAQLPDPRARRGRRHPLAALLVVAAAAVLAGARSSAATGQFSRAVPQATLARLGTWQRPWSTWHVAPSETTLRWVLQQVDADELDRVVGGWLAGQAAAGHGPVAVDGKVLRGARQPGGHQAHLSAALTHDSGTVLAQREVVATTNETTQLAPLLDGVGLAGRVVTADALHPPPARPATWPSGAPTTCSPSRATSRAWPRRPAGWLPRSFPPAHTTVDRGHGRIERRSLHAAPARTTFPGARQVLVLTRHVTGLKGGKPRTEVADGITSLDACRAGPARLGVLVRGQWQIENRAHWVRDVTSGEDRSQVRAGHGPQVMACLRNLAVSLLRLAGEANIAAGLRDTAWERSRAFALPGT